MARLPRFLRKDRSTIFHVISRTALDGLPIEDVDKDFLLELIRKFSKLFFVDMLGFTIMGSHIYLVCQVYPEDQVTDKEIQKRYKQFYGEDKFIFSRRDIDYYKKRWTSL